MPQLKFAPEMRIFLLASFFMTPEVLACFSDSEYLYHILFKLRAGASTSRFCMSVCLSVGQKMSKTVKKVSKHVKKCQNMSYKIGRSIHLSICVSVGRSVGKKNVKKCHKMSKNCQKFQKMSKNFCFLLSFFLKF